MLIDTSVLVELERGADADLSGFESLWIPPHAAAELLIAIHRLPASRSRRARRFFDDVLARLVGVFDVEDADRLAELRADHHRLGRPMGFFDEAIAATALARREKILACDSDYDRFAGLAINPFEL